MCISWVLITTVWSPAIAVLYVKRTYMFAYCAAFVRSTKLIVDRKQYGNITRNLLLTIPLIWQFVFTDMHVVFSGDYFYFVFASFFGLEFVAYILISCSSLAPFFRPFSRSSTEPRCRFSIYICRLQWCCGAVFVLLSSEGAVRFRENRLKPQRTL